MSNFIPAIIPSPHPTVSVCPKLSPPPLHRRRPSIIVAHAPPPPATRNRYRRMPPRVVVTESAPPRSAPSQATSSHHPSRRHRWPAPRGTTVGRPRSAPPTARPWGLTSPTSASVGCPRGAFVGRPSPASIGRTCWPPSPLPCRREGDFFLFF
jgi:hypothetical protein